MATKTTGQITGWVNLSNKRGTLRISADFENMNSALSLEHVNYIAKNLDVFMDFIKHTGIFIPGGDEITDEAINAGVFFTATSGNRYYIENFYTFLDMWKDTQRAIKSKATAK